MDYMERASEAYGHTQGKSCGIVRHGPSKDGTNGMGHDAGFSVCPREHVTACETRINCGSERVRIPRCKVTT